MTKKENGTLTKGSWGKDISWEFIVSSEEPDISLCSAVCCITTFEGKLILVRNKQGWGFPAGHTKLGENLEETTLREVREETCALISKPRIFGHKKLTALEPTPRPDKPELFYPFPNSYVVYFYADATGFSDELFAKDIEEVKLARFCEAKELLASGGQFENILEYLLENEMIHLE